jgi:6-phosphofructokinase 1
MGRDAGDIALNSGIGAGAEEILIPEENMGTDRLLESLKRSRNSGKTSSIIVVSEGDQIGKNITKLADFIQVNLPEYEVKVTVLGHIQRGGSPSCFDRVLASRLGVGAVDALMEGKSHIMIGVNHKEVVQVPFDIAINGKKKIDEKLIRVADIMSI